MTGKFAAGDLDSVAMKYAINRARELVAKKQAVTQQDVLAMRDEAVKHLRYQLETRKKAGRSGLIEAVKGGGLFGPEEYALSKDQHKLFSAGQPYKLTGRQAFASAIRNNDLSDDDLAAAPFSVNFVGPEGDAALEKLRTERPEEYAKVVGKIVSEDGRKKIRAKALEEQWGRPDQAMTGVVGKGVAALSALPRLVTGAIGGAVREGQRVAPASTKPAESDISTQVGRDIVGPPVSAVFGVDAKGLAKAIASGDTHLFAGAVEGAKREALDALSGGLETAYTPANVLKNARKPFEDEAFKKAIAWAKQQKAAGVDVTQEDVIAQRDVFIGEAAGAAGEAFPNALESPNLVGAALEVAAPVPPVGLRTGPLWRGAKQLVAKHLPEKVAKATAYVPEALRASPELGASMRVGKDRGKVSGEAVQLLRTNELPKLKKIFGTPDEELLTQALEGTLAQGDAAAQRAALPESLRDLFDAGDTIRQAGAGTVDELGLGARFADDTGELKDFAPRDHYFPQLVRPAGELQAGVAETSPFVKSVRTRLEPGFTNQRQGGSNYVRSPYLQFERYLVDLERSAKPAKEWQELAGYAERKGLQETAEIGDLTAAQKAAAQAHKLKERAEKQFVAVDTAVDASRDRIAVGERIWDEVGKTKAELEGKLGTSFDEEAARVLKLEKDAKTGVGEVKALRKGVEGTTEELGKLDASIEKSRVALKAMDNATLLRTAQATAIGVGKARGVDAAWRAQRGAKDALNELVQRKYALETKLGSMKTQLDRQTRRVGKLEDRAKYGRENYAALMTKAGIKDPKEFDRAIAASEKYIARNQKELHGRLIARDVADKELQAANREFLEKAGAAEAIGKKAEDFEKLRRLKEQTTKEKWFYLDDASELVNARITGKKAAKLTAAGKATTRTLVTEPVYKRYQTLQQLAAPKEVGTAQTALGELMHGVMRSVVRPTQHIWRLGHTMTNPAFNPLNYVGALGLGGVAHGIRVADPSLQGAAKLTATLAAMGQRGGPVTPWMEKFLKSRYTLRGGKEVELGHVLDLMRESGLVNQARLRMGLAGESTGALEKVKGLAEKATRFGDVPYVRALSPGVQAEWIDDYQKALVFLGALEDVSDDAVLKALDYTSKYAANYKRYDAPLDAIGRDVFGFYSWMRFIAPHMLNQVFEHPERLSRFMQARNLFERYASAKVPFQEQEPDYLKGRTLPAPLMLQPERYRQYLKSGGFKPGSMTHIRLSLEDPIGMAVPFAHALEDLTRLKGPKDKEVMRLLGPVAVALNEIITGEDFETDEPIPEDILGRVRHSVEGLGASPINRYKGLYKYLRDNGRHPELMEHKLRLKVHNDWLGLETLAAKALGKDTTGAPAPTFGAFRLYESNPWLSGVGKASKGLQYGAQVKQYETDEGEE